MYITTILPTNTILHSIHSTVITLNNVMQTVLKHRIHNLQVLTANIYNVLKTLIANVDIECNVTLTL